MTPCLGCTLTVSSLEKVPHEDDLQPAEGLLVTSHIGLARAWQHIGLALQVTNAGCRASLGFRRRSAQPRQGRLDAARRAASHSAHPRRLGASLDGGDGLRVNVLMSLAPCGLVAPRLLSSLQAGACVLSQRMGYVMVEGLQVRREHCSCVYGV